MRLKDGVSMAEGVQVVSTGCIGLDIALGIGGYPRGRIIEIYGPESSGKTTLTLHAIAQMQKVGSVAAFIDAEHALDPSYARKLGVKTDELLVSQPDYGEQALEIADMLVRSNAVDIIVIDSGRRPRPQGRRSKATWATATSGCRRGLMSQALCASSRRRLRAAIACSCSSTRCAHEDRRHSSWQPRDDDGRSRPQVLRQRPCSTSVAIGRHQGGSRDRRKGSPRSSVIGRASRWSKTSFSRPAVSRGRVRHPVRVRGISRSGRHRRSRFRAGHHRKERGWFSFCTASASGRGGRMQRCTLSSTPTSWTRSRGSSSRSTASSGPSPRPRRTGGNGASDEKAPRGCRARSHEARHQLSQKDRCGPCRQKPTTTVAEAAKPCGRLF